MDIAEHRYYFYILLTFLIHFCACDEDGMENVSFSWRDDGSSLSKSFSIHRSPQSSSPSPAFVNQYYFDEDIHSHCKSKIIDFANTSSQFINCSIINARPFRMCQSCARRYLAAVNAYNTITADGEGETSCKLYLLNADRVQIIQFTYEQMNSVWENSNCNNCFNGSSEKLQLTNETKKIQELVNETFVCMVSHNVTICPIDDKNTTNCYNVACKNCSDVYHNLNSFYNRLVSKYGMLKLCMDLVDEVNNTRKVWSKEFLCVHFYNDTVVLFTLVAFFCACPIVFYLGSWIQSDEQKSKIIPQKRLATSRSAVELSIN